MNKSEMSDEKLQRIWNITKVMNRINFLSMTEKPFYVKRAIAREALRLLEEEAKKPQVTTK